MTSGPGLFGKLPETGDFISRGLALPERRALDLWVTTHLGQRHTGWPDGGVRGLLELDTALFLMVAAPSADKVGRRFALVAVTKGHGVSLEQAEIWCDRAVVALAAAADGSAGLEDTLAALEKIEPKERAGPDGVPSLWCRATPPQPCDIETIEHLFSSD